jgi:hypothetical protein
MPTKEALYIIVNHENEINNIDLCFGMFMAFCNI